MKVLIVEDEAPARDKLQQQLKKVSVSIEVMACTDSVAETIKWLQSNSCDLIFLDIHLSDGLGFKIFESVGHDIPVIFTTAYDQYTLQAFKVNSMDYLLKPIKLADLEESLNKYERLSKGVDLMQLMQELDQRQPIFRKRFMVHAGERISTINIEEVAYFYAEGKYCFLIDRKGKQHLIDMTLDKLSGQLDPLKFHRANRQFIIGIDAIDQMFAYGRGKIKIKLDPPFNKETVVSAERASGFKQWLNA